MQDRILETYLATKGISCLPRKFGIALRIEREKYVVEAFVTYEEMARRPETMEYYISDMEHKINMEKFNAELGK